MKMLLRFDILLTWIATFLLFVFRFLWFVVHLVFWTPFSFHHLNLFPRFLHFRHLGLSVFTRNLSRGLSFLTCSGRKEGNVLFNDALNTFYLRLYGVGHMVKDHSDSEIGNPLQPHRLLFPISSKGSFICIIPQTG